MERVLEGTRVPRTRESPLDMDRYVLSLTMCDRLFGALNLLLLTLNCATLFSFNIQCTYLGDDVEDPKGSCTFNEGKIGSGSCNGLMACCK